MTQGESPTGKLDTLDAWVAKADAGARLKACAQSPGIRLAAHTRAGSGASTPRGKGTSLVACAGMGARWRGAGTRGSSRNPHHTNRARLLVTTACGGGARASTRNGRGACRTTGAKRLGTHLAVSRVRNHSAIGRQRHGQKRRTRFSHFWEEEVVCYVFVVMGG